MQDERDRLRVDARGVNSPCAPVHGDVERAAGAMHGDLPQPSLNVDFVPHVS
jgi:hypothetical protein